MNILEPKHGRDHLDRSIRSNVLSGAELGVIHVRSATSTSTPPCSSSCTNGTIRTKARAPYYHGHAIAKIQKSWAGALKRAKITRRLRPYDLRHTFATTALESGAYIGAVADIMGSSPETIRSHYQHVSREAKRQTINLIPTLFDGHD